MFHSIFKLIVFLNFFLLFIINLQQTTIIDASPIMVIDDNLARSTAYLNRLVPRNNRRGAPILKFFLHSNDDQQTLIKRSRFCTCLLSHRRPRKKTNSTILSNVPNIFRSTGTQHKKLRASKRIQNQLDDRSNRFRMLDPDEFQEMLNSMNPQMNDEQSKNLNNIDTIGGMILENYWSRS